MFSTTFVYIPKGAAVCMDDIYFRIIERTSTIATMRRRKLSGRMYGAMRDENQLHAAIVEIGKNEREVKLFYRTTGIRGMLVPVYL